MDSQKTQKTPNKIQENIGVGWFLVWLIAGVAIIDYLIDFLSATDLTPAQSGPLVVVFMFLWLVVLFAGRKGLSYILGANLE